jgi:hypothetical protein
MATSDPARRARDRRYRAAASRNATPVTIPTLRSAELRRLFQHRYGHTLPDDDAGRDDAFVMAHHLAHGQDAERRIGLWLGLWTPWMGSTEANQLITRVITKPLRWRADKLGIRINLTETERQRLAITTIGSVEVTKAERLQRRRERDRLRRRRQLRAQGAKPRAEYEANSASRTKPWEALGISRRSWYHNQTEQPREAQVPNPPKPWEAAGMSRAKWYRAGRPSA